MNMMTRIEAEASGSAQTVEAPQPARKTQWETKVNRYRLAKALEDLHFAKSPDQYDDAYEDEGLRHSDERHDALLEVLLLPAPHMFAFAEKLRISLDERIDDSWYRGHEALSMLVCDANRLINDREYGPLWKEMIADRDRVQARELKE